MKAVRAFDQIADLIGLHGKSRGFESFQIGRHRVTGKGMLAAPVLGAEVIGVLFDQGGEAFALVGLGFDFLGPLFLFPSLGGRERLLGPRINHRNENVGSVVLLSQSKPQHH